MPNQLHDIRISYPVINKIGIFSVINDPLITQNRKMLRYIGSTRLYFPVYFADAQLFILEKAKNF